MRCGKLRFVFATMGTVPLRRLSLRRLGLATGCAPAMKANGSDDA